METIAVLMSTYNGDLYLREQIDSILSQKGDFELHIWVRDDGSTDNTINILEDYANNGKLKWYSGPNMGAAKSFLDLLNHCQGYQYYAFADQDDYWLPNKLMSGIERIGQASVPALYFSNAELVDQKLATMNRNVYKNNPATDFYTLTCAGGLLGCTMIFNKKLAEYIWKVDTPKNIVMHDFYMASICVAVEGRIIYDNIPTMKYRQHGNNVVGVSHGIVKTIISRFEDIITKEEISVADQATEIIKLYADSISDDKIKWLNMVAGYRKNFISRCRLAMSNKTKYINYNMSFKLRMSIICGNR